MTNAYEELCEELTQSELLNNLDWENALEDSECEDEFNDAMEELIYQHEVIYYHNAMEYLAEHDPSLSESMSYAYDSCIDIRQINSETLATLHMQGKMLEELAGVEMPEEAFKAKKELEAA